MSWLRDLSEMYPILMDKLPEGKKPVPIFHIRAQTKIMVAINAAGKLIGAEEIQPTHIIIPTTEEAGTRTSNITPHIVLDNLKYMAGDYTDYNGKSNNDNKKPDYKEYYNAFIEQLEPLATDALYGNEKLLALYSYVRKGTLASDLIAAGVLKYDDNRLVMVRSNKPYQSSIIKFTYGPNTEAITEDEEVQRKVIAYIEDRLLPQIHKRGLCLITGEEDYITKKHPKIYLQAKLVAADRGERSGCMTFRGDRAKTADDVCTIGVQCKEKTYSSLEALIKSKGHTIRLNTGSNIVNICTILKRRPDKAITAKIFSIGEQPDEETLERYKEANDSFLKDLKNTLFGTQESDTQDIIDDPNNEVIIYSLVTPSKGIAYIDEYTVLPASTVYKNCVNWHKGVGIWSSSNKKYVYKSPTELAKVIAFSAGTYKRDNAHYNKVRKELMLEVCLKGKCPNINYVRAAARRALRSAHAGEKFCEKYLETSYSLTRLYYNRKGKEVPMKLDHEFTDRSYLFGRLTALADYTEKTYLDSKSPKGRAERATQVSLNLRGFCQRPAEKNAIFLDRNLPRYRKEIMKDGQKGGLLYIIDKTREEVMSLFNIDDFTSNKPADEPLFVAGYETQKAYFYTKKDKEN